MTSLLFFGSDQYAHIVLDYLHAHSDLDITHFSNLSSFDRIILGDGGDTIGLAASFPHLFPPNVISAFNGHLYNLHPSLLPQYRNVAPVPYALAMGDQETGITLQKIDAKIDHGEIIAQIKEPILPEDTTPILLTRLFTMGAELFLDHFNNPLPATSYQLPATPLVFTHKLTGDSGYLEWPLVLKLIKQEAITASDTSNSLITLRQIHHPDRSSNILPDLVRALDGYEKVWTIAPTKKGELRITFIYAPGAEIRVLLPGKPRPISWNDFSQYYLPVSQ